jgi:ABC-type transport system involved in multi-copper enzyme maturation permease subunit
MRLALLMFVGVVLMYAQVLGLVMGAPGLYFFTMISWINFCFATLASTFLFSTTITEEKEERTLGLLRMADVGPLPLLIGKSAPRLVAVVLIIFVQFPFTLLAITLGGISWTQVAATFCTLLGHVVLIGGIGLLFSVVFRQTGVAIGMTFLFAIGLITVPWFLLGVLSPTWGIVPATSELSPVAQFLLEYGLPTIQAVVDASAAPRLAKILGTGFNENPIGFQVLSNLGAGAGLFLLSWLLFDPCNRNLDDEVHKSTPVTRLISKRARRSRRAWRLAIVGKDFRALAGGWKMVLVRLAAYVSVLASILYAVNDFRWSRVDPEEFGQGLYVMMFYFVLPIELTLLAARLFRTEIQERTWPLLLSLPLSLPEIAYAKLAGALFALAPLSLCFCAGVVLDADDFVEFLGDLVDDPEVILIFALYVAYLLLLGHLTTFFSLLSNAWAGALLAIVATFMGFILNYMVAIIPIFLLQFSGGGPPAWGPSTMEFYMAVAGVISLLVVLLLVGCLHYLIGVRLKSVAAQ